MFHTHLGECPGCGRTVSVGEHRVLTADATAWHEHCWLTLSADAKGVNYLEDCLL